MMNTVFVFLIALAWNEGAKQYIDQYIKFNDGTPMYYIAYAVVLTLVGLGIRNMTR